MAAQSLSDALGHLVKGIVDHPDDVRVASRETSRGEILEVRVHPQDLGRVIGRGGRTAQSLRTVIGALARGERVRIDVIDTDANDTTDAGSVDTDQGDADS